MSVCKYVNTCPVSFFIIIKFKCLKHNICYIFKLLQKILAKK